MATFTAIRCKKQSASSMRGVIDYVEQEKKRAWVRSEEHTSELQSQR